MKNSSIASSPSAIISTSDSDGDDFIRCSGRDAHSIFGQSRRWRPFTRGHRFIRIGERNLSDGLRDIPAITRLIGQQDRGGRGDGDLLSHRRGDIGEEKTLRFPRPDIGLPVRTGSIALARISGTRPRAT